jgi:rubrerythrin
MFYKTFKNVWAVFKSMKRVKTLKTLKSEKTSSKEDILEFIKLAMTTEQNGIKFYSDVKTKINDFNMSKLMDLLIEQEKKHLEYFTKIYEAELSGGDKKAEIELASYKSQTAPKSPLFAKKKVSWFSGKKKRIIDTLAQAVQLEIEGHDMYMYMSRNVKSAKIKKFLVTVANEELKHRDFLESYHDVIYNTGYWQGIEHTRLEM